MIGGDLFGVDEGFVIYVYFCVLVVFFSEIFSVLKCIVNFIENIDVVCLGCGDVGYQLWYYCGLVGCQMCVGFFGEVVCVYDEIG